MQTLPSGAWLTDPAVLQQLRVSCRDCGGVLVYEPQRGVLFKFGCAAKRTFDVVVASLALLALAPLLLAITVAIWVETPGPVFFRQRRGGKGGEVFRIYKFRSM